ncbi:integral membrane efflux protein [Streptomyces laurentii]|uniref:Integral membrane efflux protein n=1 Tax=Streptomyces laurentii TaxID=39478 RepID=A0A169N8B6_STRLU|nr:integral membrane efflux protein [Streptomyces laurentii]
MRVPLYLAAVLVSGFGTTALWLVSGIWVKSLTGSDALAALTAFALWAPALLGPLLGSLVDRVRRRPLLVGVNLAMAALLPLLLAVDGPGRVWLLFAVLLVYGTQGAVHETAETALAAGTLDQDRLGELNGLRMTVNEAMKLLAPLVAAGLFARYGGGPVALLDAASFAVAAGAFALLRVREERPAPRRRPRISDGARLLWAPPEPRRLVLAGGFTMLLAGLNGALIYAVVDHVLGRAPAYAGVLYAVQGAGSVVAGLTAGPLLRRLPERAPAVLGLGLFAVGAAGRALPSDAAALAASALIGVGLPWVLISATTAVQRHVPAEAVGRAAGTAHTLVFAPNAVALALGAGLTTLVDVRVVLPLLGIAGLAGAAVLARTGRGLRNRPRTRTRLRANR